MQWRSFGMGLSVLGQWLSKYSPFLLYRWTYCLIGSVLHSTFNLAVMLRGFAQTGWRFFFLYVSLTPRFPSGTIHAPLSFIV